MKKVVIGFEEFSLIDQYLATRIKIPFIKEDIELADKVIKAIESAKVIEEDNLKDNKDVTHELS